MIPTGVARRRVQPAEARRDLAVDRQRVAEPREPEHRRLGGRDQDDQRRDRHQVLRGLADPGLLERVGHAQQRRLDPAVPGLRQHRRGHERDPDVRDDGRHEPHADQPPQARAADPHLPGQPGGGVDAAERDEHEREREDHVLERGRARDRGRVGQHLGLEQQREPERPGSAAAARCRRAPGSRRARSRAARRRGSP